LNCCVYITEKPFAQSHTIKQFLALIITSQFFSDVSKKITSKNLSHHFKALDSGYKNFSSLLSFHNYLAFLLLYLSKKFSPRRAPAVVTLEAGLWRGKQIAQRL
jgi:hypothetical protein